MALGFQRFSINSRLILSQHSYFMGGFYERKSEVLENYPSYLNAMESRPTKLRQSTRTEYSIYNPGLGVRVDAGRKEG